MSVNPKPLTSLLASAQRLTAEKMVNRRVATANWQDDAWEMYDLVGEQHFLAATLASRMSQAKLFVGEISETGEAIPTEKTAIKAILDAVGNSASALQQMLQRLGVNLFVTGDAWMVGIPTHFIDPRVPYDNEEPQITELDWRILSVSEVTFNRSGQVTIKQGGDDDIIVNVDDVFLIRIWRPHPRRWWESDSPTRASLPVLRELVGLTMHISAQVDSRLAGAGLLVVPHSAQRALNIAAGVNADAGEDQFTEALMEAMLTPIGDRASASALVPLVVTVPDESTGLFNYLSFATPLDSEARSLRDEAIRRLALGQDAPPELLLGTSGMNHWGAWLVREDVVNTHLEPPLALVCDALTTQYLWPVLIAEGMTEEQARKYVVWYDVSHMIMRPNRATDAAVLYDKGVIDDGTLREASGFTDDDAPLTATMPVERSMAMELAKANPGLFTDPGLPAVAAQIKELLEAPMLPQYRPPDGEAVPMEAAEPTLPPKDVPDVTIPATDTADAPIP